MLKVNENYYNVGESYLFSEIAHRVEKYKTEHPEADIIKMGIGDVTRPLCPAVVEGLLGAASEMGHAKTFRGYGPEQGYDFLRLVVASYYAERDVLLDADEIFISDGAKSDLGNILDIFDRTAVAMIPDPVYPVYVDTNIMDGRKLIYADATAKNGFLPTPSQLGDVHADLIYLCSPNNPTGAVYNRSQLKEWVDYANAGGAIILFDAAYESFVVEEELPRSIFEIEGARTCAIEFCSLSKTAGFTGTRCGYTVIPMELDRGGCVNKLWQRRQTTKFNGVSYIIQRGAAAAFSEEGRRQIRANIDYYRENARIITDALQESGIWYTGGKNSPYIWLECPGEMDSWEFFSFLLENAQVVGTPGAGFGKNGNNFFRLTSFSTHEATSEAMRRLKEILK